MYYRVSLKGIRAKFPVSTEKRWFLKRIIEFWNIDGGDERYFQFQIYFKPSIICAFSISEYQYPKKGLVILTNCEFLPFSIYKGMFIPSVDQSTFNKYIFHIRKHCWYLVIGNTCIADSLSCLLYDVSQFILNDLYKPFRHDFDAS